MIPSRLNRITQCPTEDKLRPTAVQFEIFKPVNDNRLTEATIDARRKPHFRRSDALGRRNRLFDCRAVVVICRRKP